MRCHIYNETKKRLYASEFANCVENLADENVLEFVDLSISSTVYLVLMGLINLGMYLISVSDYYEH